MASDSIEATDPPSLPKNVYKDPDDGRQRFLLELEFVQCLANPTYIHYGFRSTDVVSLRGLLSGVKVEFDQANKVLEEMQQKGALHRGYLAQNRYFEDEAFIGYLKYLQYWQRPEYLKFIMYPHCLFFLELLQKFANFRNAMAHPANKELAHRQQFYFWKNYRSNRLKHILPKPLPESSVSATPASAAPPALPPTTIPAAASSIPPTPPQAPSPMQYGSASVRNDPRNSGVEKRKRK
ncbi:hypothetical protein SASPL_141807 [Salvia splendens]|uniref:Mediator of RNA polymerase II transcription subunit 31 n=1 Tax=Salvia splendens TaxID=180675 RepID=A0A8X8Z8V5_SALSN|nr:hypothetical protein SASPL_141807 [Salvia splendens]